jgi:hypothetical protein
VTALGAMNQPPEMMATRKRAIAADFGAKCVQCTSTPRRVNAPEMLTETSLFFCLCCASSSDFSPSRVACLVGNKGYRRYLKVEGSGHFVIDEKTVIRGLDTLQQVEANFQGRRFLFRSQFTAHASQAVLATGVAIPPTLREIQ